jgi:ABC-type multidrug transport system fused ATPase/permease subunit
MRIRSELPRKLRPLRVLWTALSRRRRRQLLGLQVLSLLAAVGEVANLGALLPFLRLLANPQEGLRALGPLSAPLRRLPEQHLLLSLGLAFMAVVVVSSLLRVFTIRSQLRLAALITADLGQQAFASLLRRPFAWHLDQNSSTVLGYLTKDVDQVSGTIQPLLLVVVNLAIVVLLGGSLFALAPSVMGVMGGLLAGFYVLVFRFTRGTLKADGQKLTQSYQSSLQVAQEALGGIRDVLLDRSQQFFEQAYASQNLRYRLAISSIDSKARVPRYLIEGFAVLMIVGLSLGLALGGQGIESQLPLLGTLALGSYRMLQPLQQCFAALSSLQANQASLLRLEPFLLSNESNIILPEASSPTHSTRTTTNKALLALDRVSFRYAFDGPLVLQDLDLVIQLGERLAFVGSTGSGKSTCCDLILGLLQPSEGRLLVQGEDLHGQPGRVDSWQRRVAYVPQQIYLSDSTFAANIAFGVPANQINPRRVRRAAEQARIADLIESSPEKYETVVGERGVRLSGGQRQRIGIARALYKQADLLVLDEATSALDNRTEAKVMEAVDALERDKTVVMIAHRLSTVERCDRIVLLEQGQIRAIGTFKELSSNSAEFRAFVNQPQATSP